MTVRRRCSTERPVPTGPAFGYRERVSARLVGKLDVDLLCQVALVGPGDARAWIPLVDDPDAFGRALWHRNWFVVEGQFIADDPDQAAAMAAAPPSRLPEPPEDWPLPRPDYTFTPLPITVTAAETLRACAYYGYQTFCELDDPLFAAAGSRVARFAETPEGQAFEALRARLQMIGGRGDGSGPWGWTAADLQARSDRPAPVIPAVRIVVSRPTRVKGHLRLVHSS